MPKQLSSQCCGMMFNSRGLKDAAAAKGAELEAALMVRAAKVFPELLGVMQAQGTVAALVFSFADGNTFEVEADKL